MTVKNLTQIRFGTTRNVALTEKNPKKHNACRKGYIWNPATCSFENVASICWKIYWRSHWQFSDYVWWNYRNNKKYSDINCSSKNHSSKFQRKKCSAKWEIFVTLLVTVSIYAFIKYWAKEKHLLSFHNAIKKVGIGNIL